jgi:hypothetical protein
MQVAVKYPEALATDAPEGTNSSGLLLAFVVCIALSPGETVVALGLMSPGTPAACVDRAGQRQGRLNDVRADAERTNTSDSARPSPVRRAVLPCTQDASYLPSGLSPRQAFAAAVLVSPPVCHQLAQARRRGQSAVLLRVHRRGRVVSSTAPARNGLVVRRGRRRASCKTWWHALKRGAVDHGQMLRGAATSFSAASESQRGACWAASAQPSRSMTLNDCTPNGVEVEFFVWKKTLHLTRATSLQQELYHGGRSLFLFGTRPRLLLRPAGG